MKLLGDAFTKRNGDSVTRIFHGPGDAPARSEFELIAIDRFQEHYWVHFWADEKHPALSQESSDEIRDFLQSIGAKTAALSIRPFRSAPQPPSLLLGTEWPEAFTVTEKTGLQFEIRFKDMRHPGLFLDHAPLRSWLIENSGDLNVLNTFAYTGSLSVAASKGEAKTVDTLDLSAATLEWAKKNAAINDVSNVMTGFYAMDFFEFAKKSIRQKKRWDIVILDPPSFSRSKKSTFSTKKDLPRLHHDALSLLSPHGVLVTSINSENITRDYYESEVRRAAAQLGMKLDVLYTVHLPESFPTKASAPESRYLKGWAFQVRK